jgi:hypothetical protein
MKGILRSTVQKSSEILASCEQYATSNGFNNIDYLLEQMIYPQDASEDAFKALAIIDELEEDLESILRSSLKFPVETLVIERYKSPAGELAYHFEPFLYELSTAARGVGNTPAIDPSEIDTIVVPAREEGFQEVFLGENCWHAIRIHSSMIPKIRFLAVYQVAPVSAITHVAEVAAIEPWKDTQKYCVKFKEPAREIGPIPLVNGGTVTAPQNIRYTSFARVQNASSLDDVF